MDTINFSSEALIAAYRIQAWDFLVAGGALYNNLDYSFATGHEDGTFQPPATTPGGAPSGIIGQGPSSAPTTPRPGRS